MQVRNDVINNSYWELSDGCLTNFRNDIWLRHISPLCHYHKGMEQPDNTLRIHDVMDCNNDWDVEILRSLLPDSIVTLEG